MPRVSVIVPVYNGAATIGRALDSVFAQTFTDYEIVATDDGSTDDTPAILAGYGDRIRVVTQCNRGLPAARNAAILASSGEYVAFIDDDDEWMAEKLERSVAVLDQDPGCALTYTGEFRIDLAGRPMPSQESKTWGIDSPTMADMLERPWNVVPSRIMVRRAVLERCGGFDERLMTCCEDLYFLLRARECGYFRRIPDLLVRKSTRPLYPTALNREHGCEVFIQLIRQRYGASAAGLIREFRRERVKVMRHVARILMEQGRPREARRCLKRVIHYQPASPKAYRRYLKTFLPARAPRLAERSSDGKGLSPPG